MAGKALVIGAGGGFGGAMTTSLLEAGWTVTALARRPRQFRFDGHQRFSVVEGDALDSSAVTAAARSMDVIVQGFNAPYQKWRRQWPAANAAAMRGARSSGATILFPGNIYNYGPEDGRIFREDSPQRPVTRKGRLRKELELRLAEDAAASGYRVIVLRAGDYFAPHANGWMPELILKSLAKGIVTYPGPLDIGHSWAYLPDLARAGAGLLDRRAAFAPFEVFHFRGHVVASGQIFVDAISRVLERRDLRVKSLPWPLLRLAALAAPGLREVVEIKYLWEVAHELDESNLCKVLPGLTQTPFDEALGATLASLGFEATGAPRAPSGSQDRGTQTSGDVSVSTAR